MKPLLFTTLLLLSACRDKAPTPSVAPTGTPVTTVTSDAGVGSGSNQAGSNEAGSAEAVPVERVVRTPEEQERINKAAKAAAKDLEIRRQLKTPEPPRGPAPEPASTAP